MKIQIKQEPRYTVTLFRAIEKLKIRRVYTCACGLEEKEKVHQKRFMAERNT